VPVYGYYRVSGFSPAYVGFTLCKRAMSGKAQHANGGFSKKNDFEKSFSG